MSKGFWGWLTTASEQSLFEKSFDNEKAPNYGFIRNNITGKTLKVLLMPEKIEQDLGSAEVKEFNVPNGSYPIHNFICIKSRKITYSVLFDVNMNSFFAILQNSTDTSLDEIVEFFQEISPTETQPPTVMVYMGPTISYPTTIITDCKISYEKLSPKTLRPVRMKVTLTHLILKDVAYGGTSNSLSK